MNAAPTTLAPSLRPPRALLNVLVAGALLRLLALGYWPLWLDEGATWSWASQPTWSETVFAEANHPPLWWVVTRLWIGMFGDSEASLRAPAALLGVAGLWLTWVLALRLLDPAHAPRRGGLPRTGDGGRGRRTAVWVTGLVALSAYFVEYAQEARMYTALLVEALALSLLYLRWLDRGDRRSLILYALVGALALYTHYFAIWPLLAHAAHALWLGRRTRTDPEPVRPWPFVGAVAAAGVLFLPWFVHLVTHYERIANIAPEPFSYLVYAAWRMGAGPALAVPNRLRQEAGPSAVIAEEWPVVLAVVVLWMVPLVIGFIALRRRPGLRSLVVANLAVPVALLLAIYVRFPLIHERYLLPLAPWVFLVAAMGAFATPRGLRPVVLAGLGALMVAGTVAYHGGSARLVPEPRPGTLDGAPALERFVPDPEAPLAFVHGENAYGREPWRQAHRFVRDHSGPGDLVLLHPGYVHLVWDYYAARATDDEGRPLDPLETLHLPEQALDAVELRAAYGDRLRSRQRVFLVLAHEETPDPDHYFRALKAALARLWLEAGAAGISSTPPILFHVSWGVRVAVFTRT